MRQHPVLAALCGGAVGGGTVIDIAKVLTVAKSTDRVDDLYDRMANLEKEHELIIVPTTCGTGSECTNISAVSYTHLTLPTIA